MEYYLLSSIFIIKMEISLDAKQLQADEQSILLAIKKEEIVDILSHLIGIVEKRNSIAQLTHIKLEPIDEYHIKFTTTDMSVSITETQKIENTLKKGLTLPATTLYDIVKKFPPGSLINLQQRGNNIEITSEAVFFALPFLESDSFPSIDEDNFTSTLSISSEDFIQLFGKTKFTISTEDSRHNLTGLYLHSRNNELRAAATDGHRLSLTVIKLLQVEQFSILIPRKTVLELVKIVEKSQEKIQISISHNKVKFVHQGITLVSKLISAEFPDYTSVIPKEYNRKIKIKKSDLISAVDRVSAIYMDKSKSARLNFHDKVLTISTSNSDSSNAHETLPTDYGSDFEICFNYSYLLETLHQIDGDVVEINGNDNKSAIMINNVNTIYIIMPMSV